MKKKDFKLHSKVFMSLAANSNPAVWKYKDIFDQLNEDCWGLIQLCLIKCFEYWSEFEANDEWNLKQYEEMSTAFVDLIKFLVKKCGLLL